MLGSHGKQNGLDAPSRYSHSSWITPALLNGWVTYSTVYQDPSYMVTSDGTLRIKGLIKSGTINTPAFVLPKNLAPKRRTIFPAATNGGYGRLDIDVDGSVIPVSGGTGYYSLDVSFQVNQ